MKNINIKIKTRIFIYNEFRKLFKFCTQIFLLYEKIIIIYVICYIYKENRMIERFSKILIIIENFILINCKQIVLKKNYNYGYCQLYL